MVFQFIFKLSWFVEHAMVFTWLLSAPSYAVCSAGMQTCDWEAWPAWSPCSNTCGNGMKYRIRGVCCRDVKPPLGYLECINDCNLTLADGAEKDVPCTEYSGCTTPKTSTPSQSKISVTSKPSTSSKTPSSTWISKASMASSPARNTIQYTANTQKGNGVRTSSSMHARRENYMTFSGENGKILIGIIAGITAVVLGTTCSVCLILVWLKKREKNDKRKKILVQHIQSGIEKRPNDSRENGGRLNRIQHSVPKKPPGNKERGSAPVGKNVKERMDLCLEECEF